MRSLSEAPLYTDNHSLEKQYKMNKERIIKSLRLNYFVAFISTLVIIIAFESRMLYKGALRSIISEENAYNLEIAAVMLTIGLIPLALKSFSRSMEKAKAKGNAEVLKKFGKMSLLRIALLFVVIIANAFIYYGINYEGALYCGLIGYGALIYSYPTIETLESYLDNNGYNRG